MAVVEKAQEAHQGVQRMHRAVSRAPGVIFGFGVAALVLWLAVLTIQIQTSEYLALGMSTRVAGVSWSVLVQPWFLISGQAPPGVATAWLYAWIVEFVTLVFGTVLGVVLEGLKHANPWYSRGFAVFGFALVVLNSWADYSSTPGSSPLMQALMAIAIGGMAVTGLVIVLTLFFHAFKEV